MDKTCTDLLIGWNEISIYTGVSRSTLKIWQKKLGFPIQIIPATATKNVVSTTKPAIKSWMNVAFAADGGDYLHNQGLA